MNKEIQCYRTKYQNAARDLSDATARIFPVGAIVTAKIGNANIRGTVVESGGSWWASPDQVLVKNEKTGKIRRVFASSELNNLSIG